MKDPWLVRKQLDDYLKFFLQAGSSPDMRCPELIGRLAALIDAGAMTARRQIAGQLRRALANIAAREQERAPGLYSVNAARKAQQKFFFDNVFALQIFLAEHWPVDDCFDDRENICDPLLHQELDLEANEGREIKPVIALPGGHVFARQTLQKYFATSYAFENGVPRDPYRNRLTEREIDYLCKQGIPVREPRDSAAVSETFLAGLLPETFLRWFSGRFGRIGLKIGLGVGLLAGLLLLGYGLVFFLPSMASWLIAGGWGVVVGSFAVVHHRAENHDLIDQMMTFILFGGNAALAVIAVTAAVSGIAEAVLALLAVSAVVSTITNTIAAAVIIGAQPVVAALFGGIGLIFETSGTCLMEKFYTRTSEVFLFIPTAVFTLAGALAGSVIDGVCSAIERVRRGFGQRNMPVMPPHHQPAEVARSWAVPGLRPVAGFSRRSASLSSLSVVATTLPGQQFMKMPHHAERCNNRVARPEGLNFFHAVSRESLRVQEEKYETKDDGMMAENTGTRDAVSLPRWRI